MSLLAGCLCTLLPLSATTACQPSSQGAFAAIEIRSEPAAQAKLIAAIPRVAKSAVNPKITRIDTHATPDSAWLLVEYATFQGWVRAERLICRATPSEARAMVEAAARRALSALDARDMRELAAVAHPVRGVRFSPYAFLDPVGNVRLSATAVVSAMGDRTLRRWGTYDGSGDPIRLSFGDYYRRFIYDRPFAAMAKLTYNSAAAVRGTTHDNSRDLFPNAIVVDAFVAGGAPERQGTDYRILRLLFEQHRGTWFLTYVVHDQWTI